MKEGGRGALCARGDVQADYRRFKHVGFHFLILQAPNLTFLTPHAPLPLLPPSLASQGRNGKGKSTLLKWIAARRMPGVPAATSIYYVTQDLQLSDEAQEQTPVQFVLNQGGEGGGVKGREGDVRRGRRRNCILVPFALWPICVLWE